MKPIMTTLVALFVAVISAVPASAALDSQAAIRRFALFVGVNDGGPGRETLRYAVRDAESAAKLFRDMGGIKASDGELLVEPSITELSSKMKSVSARITKAKEQSVRTEFVFYYSGHSDEEGMLIGKKKYTYKDLKDTIEALPADMKIVILDSCSSGALTKVKGGVKTQPFLMDSSITMKGYAFLTSSSADESSQESESLKGSYFTYALLSGLRGAGDASGDGKVTINEAYQYAYNETLANTERTIGGSQHPNYDIRMKGSGDVVMTDLRETSASLRFAKDVSGRIFIRDESDLLVSEITKVENRTIEVGLAPGSYRVTVENNKLAMQSIIFLNDNDRVELGKQSFKPVKKEMTTSRGGVMTSAADDDNAVAVSDNATNDDGLDSMGVAERARARLNGNRAGNTQVERVRNDNDDTSDNSGNRNTLGNVNVNVNVNTGNNTQSQNMNQDQNQNQSQDLDSFGVAERARSNAAARRADKPAVTNTTAAAASSAAGTNGGVQILIDGMGIGEYISSKVSNALAPINSTNMSATGDYAYVPLNVGFVPGIDLNTFLKGGKAKVINNLSGSAFIGHSERVIGAAGAGFMQTVSEELLGVSGAGFMSFNGNVTGGIGAGFMTFASNVLGIEGAGFMSFAKKMEGAQGAGFASFADNVTGIQGAGFMSIASNLVGCQGSGFANFASDVLGAQMAGGFNSAKNVDGAQFSIVNIASGKVNGAQFGIVNISHEMNGAPIGLVSIVEKGGQTHLQAYADETGFMNVAWLQGAKHVYNIYTAGANLLGDKFFETGALNPLTQYKVGLGLGLAMPLWIFSANLEGIASVVYSSDNPLKLNNSYQLRLYGSVNLFVVTVLAGVSFNYANYNPSFVNLGKLMGSIDTPVLDATVTINPPTSLKLPFSSADHVFWPGFFVGIQF